MLVAHIRKTTASDVMTPSPVVISNTDKIASAKTIMKRRRIDHLPVVQEVTYTRVGWNLAKIFDEMSDALKKKVSHRYIRRQRESVRTSNRLN